MRTQTQESEKATRHRDTAAWLYLDLDRLDYKEALELQYRLVAARNTRVLEKDILLLLEHPAVFTLGRRGGLENLTVSREFLQKTGIPVIQVERGGNITYHGPGQLIAYPIIDLDAMRMDVDRYVEHLEEIMIRTAREFDVQAHRNALNRGIWMGNNKMGSIGIAIRKGVSFHGLALNITVALEPFNWINPCGLDQIGITSIQKESGQAVSMAIVRQVFIKHITAVFNIGLVAAGRDEVEQIIES
jgi:lipoate-protein ligase B